MRVVLDTNTLVSGVISANGPPRRLLNAARAQAFTWFTSPALLAELLDVLSREKFTQRLSQAGLSAQGIVSDLWAECRAKRDAPNLSGAADAEKVSVIPAGSRNPAPKDGN
ncbi:MAG: putative toxin-antitoxin system toxin component, PIN family [Candidatus Methylumidiphilus sp.]